MPFTWSFFTEDGYFDWYFHTGGRPATPVGRQCHYGPMIDVEIVMAQKYVLNAEWEILRARVLGAIVDTTQVATQTREVILRSLNNQLGPIFQRLAPVKRELQVLICEKRNSVDIERDLQSLNPVFVEMLPRLVTQGVPVQHVDLLLSAIRSNNVIMRVAGKAATILLVSFLELDG